MGRLPATIVAGAAVLGLATAMASCTAFTEADSPPDPAEAGAQETSTAADGDASPIIPSLDAAAEGAPPTTPPLPNATTRCGTLTCAICCLEAKPRCIGPTDSCAGPILACDDRDDCPIETSNVVLPRFPIVCCYKPAMNLTGCFRSDRCDGAGDEALCDSTRVNQCAASGRGTCSATATLSDYMRCAP